jgi:hypothetical protein
MAQDEYYDEGGGAYTPPKPQSDWSSAKEVLNRYNGGGAADWNTAKGIYESFAAKGEGNHGDWVNWTFDRKNKWTSAAPAASSGGSGFTSKQRDQVVSGWTKSTYAPTRQGIQQYLTSIGGLGSGWTIVSGDKVRDPNGRVYDWIGNVNAADAARRSGYTTDPRFAHITGATSGGSSKSSGGGSSASPVGQAMAAPASAAASDLSTLLTSQQGNDMKVRQELIDQLLARARQSVLDNPESQAAIRKQADTFAAQQERARRNYLADAAEDLGPNANLRNEQRLTAERAGQASAGFEAELMGRELTAKRAEISDALSAMESVIATGQGTSLTVQAQELQRQKMLLDDAIAKLGLKQNNSQFNANLDYQKSALSQQGRIANNQLGFNYDVFDWERSPYNPRNMPPQGG